MKLTHSKLRQLNDSALTPDESALRHCQFAADFIHTGQYETARDVLGVLWQGIGNRPELKGLSPLAAAEVLLQCGVLSGWLGSVRQIHDAQEKAKDLLSEAVSTGTNLALTIGSAKSLEKPPNQLKAKNHPGKPMV